MAGNGPPPNPGAQRRNTRTGLVRLPSGGHTGRIPRWPLPDNPRLTARIQLLEEKIIDLEERDADEGLTRTEQTSLTRQRQQLRTAEIERDVIRDSEKTLWSKLWRTPQATEWARLKWDREVAQYVRHKAAGEIGSLEDSKEARLRADALGLTPKGLKSLMWSIDHDQVAEKRDQKTAAATGTDGAAPRRRFVVIDPGKK